MTEARETLQDHLGADDPGKVMVECCGAIADTFTVVRVQPSDGLSTEWACSTCVLAPSLQPVEPDPPSWSTDCMVGNGVRSERQRRIDAESWKAQRHRDELALELPTTLTEPEYLAVLARIQWLREITATFATPDLVDWSLMPPA